MLRDLAALAPPLIVCGAFLIGVAMFLRRQLGPRHDQADPTSSTDIHDDGSNAGTGDQEASPAPDHDAP